MLKYYLAEALEPTLLLAPLCSLLGIIVASTFSKVNILAAALLIIGVFFAQMAVNVLNDYVDYGRGIDKESTKTKFSGGSTLIIEGKVTHRGVLFLGLIALAISGTIGIYFIIHDPIVLPVVIIGGLSVIFYTSHFTRVPYLPEPLTVLNFMLCGVGSFLIIASSTTHLLTAILVCFPSGIVVGTSLLINEMPDRTVDRKHGRRSGAVMLKSNTKIAYYYLLMQIAGYASLIIGIALGLLHYTQLIFVAIIPLMVFCFMGMLKYSSPEKFEKYMGTNAFYSILFIILLIVGYAI